MSTDEAMSASLWHLRSVYTGAAMDIAGPIVNAGDIALGAVLAWASAGLINRRTRQDAQASRRRDAYAALILRLDELRRIFTAPHSIDAATTKVGTLVGQTVAAIEPAHVAVLLTGPANAREAAEKAMRSAWAIYDWFYPDDPSQLRSDLGALVDRYATDARAFNNTARSELK